MELASNEVNNSAKILEDMHKEGAVSNVEFMTVSAILAVVERLDQVIELLEKNKKGGIHFD